jgi:ferrous iron transport protein A
VTPAEVLVEGADVAEVRPRHLGQLSAGSRATILSLTADRRLLQRFDALGLRPGQQVEVLRRGWLSGILHLRVGMTELMLRRSGALAILVSPMGR